MCLKKRFFTFIFTAHILLIGLACQQKQIDPAENPKALIQQMVAAVGGVDRFYALKDVEYTYIYHDLTNDKKDVSLERYVFDGELSWAHYETREKNVVPQMEGEVNQGFNGSESWMTIDGKLVDDNPKLTKLCDFLRKTILIVKPEPVPATANGTPAMLVDQELQIDPELGQDFAPAIVCRSFCLPAHAASRLAWAFA